MLYLPLLEVNTSTVKKHNMTDTLSNSVVNGQKHITYSLCSTSSDSTM